MTMSRAQNRLDSTLQAAKKATAPTVAKPVKAVHSTVAETPRRSSTRGTVAAMRIQRSEEHTSELQSHSDLVCRLLLEKKKEMNPEKVLFNCASSGRQFY